jgi:hypothetical protein
MHRFDGEPGATRGDRLSRMFCCLIGVYRRLGTKLGKKEAPYVLRMLPPISCLVGVFCSLVYAFHALSISRTQMSVLELCPG